MILGGRLGGLFLDGVIFGGGSKLGKIVGLDLALAFENSIKGGVFWDYGVIFVWTGEHH